MLIESQRKDTGKSGAGATDTATVCEDQRAALVVHSFVELVFPFDTGGFAITLRA